MLHLMLFNARLKAKLINEIENLTQVVATLDSVFDLIEYLTDLEFDGVRAFRCRIELG
jgi:hypothetical protein